MTYANQARLVVGLAIFLAGCTVKPMTPPPDTDATQTSAEPTATLLAAAATSITPTMTSVLTSVPAASSAASATAMPPSPTEGNAANVSPTPALIIVADVALMAATPTATRAPAVVVHSSPAPTHSAAVSVAEPASGDVAAAEQYCVSLINAQRTALGLAPLSADAALMSVANGRVADMVARGYTGHNDPVTGEALGPAAMRAAGYTGLVGENWYGSRLGPPAIADVAMKWFMTDAPHYQNILNRRYSGVGVGIAYNGQQWLLVQDFAGN